MTRPRSTPRTSQPKTKTPTPSPPAAVEFSETTELPGWEAPPDPEPTTISEPEETVLELVGSAGSDDDLSSKPARSSTTGSSPGSFADRKAINAGVRRLVGVLTRIVHRTLDPGEDGCWLADRQDLEEIGDPLTSLLIRHAPIPDGRGGDVGDGIGLLSAIGGYVMKNLDRRSARRGQPYVDEEGNFVPAGNGMPVDAGLAAS